MLRTFLTALLVLLAGAPAAAAACTPPAQPGLVVAVCAGEAEITGPAGGPVTEYRDADPTRLPEVRVTGRGTVATLYVARLDHDGLLMDSTMKPAELPAGVALELWLSFEAGVVEPAGGSEDVTSGPARVRRVFAPPRTPLSEAAWPRVSAACLGFRRDVRPYLFGAGEADFLRQLRGFRRGRARLARRLTAAVAVTADRPYLVPLARSLRAGNRHLLRAERAIRRSPRLRAGERHLRAYERVLRRERPLRARLGLGECG